MTREHNWADNYTFSAAQIHRPVSVDEVRSIVARSTRIRAIGARHSFNGIADSPGDLIDLAGIDPGFLIDPERRTVTVGAATNYGVLAGYLHHAGWALHNMASLPHVSVAGATRPERTVRATGWAIFRPQWQHSKLSPRPEIWLRSGRGDRDFDGVVVSLGAFGIVAAGDARHSA